MHILDDKFKEECGVFGIFSRDNDDIDVASMTYYGLYALQHRGQESAGIVVSNGHKLNCYKGMGLVSDVFNESILSIFDGKSAIGHVRYSTTGSSHIENAQPLMKKYKSGNIAIAHNGNLVNAKLVKDELSKDGCLFDSEGDTEVILNLIVENKSNDLKEAISSSLKNIKGSYALVILTEDKLIGIRDPNGIRPLCIGKIDNSYILCSESCALDAIGADFVRDVLPGEIVIIDKEGLKSDRFTDRIECKTCAFEYVYFARPDSTIDGINVYESRVKAGKILYRESPVDADVVIGVPDSGIPAAVGFAEASGIPYGIGFIKNKYIARTFIAPSKKLRERAVSVKLNPLKMNVEGKRVVIVDDSIVRGTTSKRLVEILRKAGAKEVHFRVSSPVVKCPCYFGIDTPYRKDLIGANFSVDEIRQKIGADSLAYIDIAGMIESFGKNDKKDYCLGCFNGLYPMPTPDKETEALV
ncbi:amidophosphoribosyltransferase [Clostridium algifaecis]|uniref:Amidophosphoribosyltransferase n=1 Tax=Clostridium algifaecis TaxID=1472040 RepID=A0ABS4KTQ1_9CLOT|nr:amidophosphoribosyltransferase [Clostridium algifaecis]MBP2033436.1 amidophosphoribosyltransferase [Clostridium algifaecis]